VNSMIDMGYDHRGCAVRVTANSQGTRLASRLPGAHPYPALATMADGLKAKPTLDDPCPGGVYQDVAALPGPLDLSEAVKGFAGSKIARAEFEEAVVRHRTRAAEAERDVHRTQVTDVELAQGFEHA
jgi:glutamine synthetase